MLAQSAQLLYAAWCGDPPLVRELLTQGVSTEVQDGKGRTPLMLAAAAQSAETVSLLLAAGADTSARNKGNRQLIDYVSDTAVAQQILVAMPAEQRSAAATRL
ncbi:MAG: ankyrin repeat domain-containing protein, partial [Akkermansia sp.]|nr:ankyrin repeat domain-containing protein [Akkermansia sp.]